VEFDLPRTSEGVRAAIDGVSATQINDFLLGLPQDHRFALLVDMVSEWGDLGADEALLASLREVTGL
jgi:hypothetical protein